MVCPTYPEPVPPSLPCRPAPVCRSYLDVEHVLREVEQVELLPLAQQVHQRRARDREAVPELLVIRRLLATPVSPTQPHPVPQRPHDSAYYQGTIAPSCTHLCTMRGGSSQE